MKALIILAFLLSFAWALHKHQIAPNELINKKFMDIRILDSKIIDISQIDGESFYGISDIAYDTNRDVLYALNDQGRLFNFRIAVKDEEIVDLKPISGYRLKNRFGKKLLKHKRDSEGMVLVSDGDKKSLLISFERYPKILKFNLKGEGMQEKKRKLTLPERLKNIRNYQGKNSSLEALTYHPKYGILTAAEFPLKKQKNGYQGIFNADGEVCKFQKDFFDNAVTEFEMMSDGNLLVLQRSVSFRSFSFDTMLKKVYLNEIKDGICRSKNLAILKSHQGWNLDNFEGLTHFKDNIYLMISDDNGNFFQKTILVMFEVLDPK